MTSHSLAGLSLRDLEYAAAVAELRHFGRAAERCGVSQPTLSEQIRKLEALLGMPLFERLPRRVVLTPQGETLLPRMMSVLRAARALLDAAQLQSGPLEGPLRLGVIATLGPYYVPALLRQVRARFPRLEPRLQEGRTVSLADALERGELDAVLMALPPPSEHLTVAPLFFERFLLAAPQGHALATAEHARLADLRNGELLLLEEGHCLRDQALSLCDLPRNPGGTRFASSLEMLRHMIAAGEGVSLLPELAVRGRSDLSALVVTRPLDDEAIGRQIGLVWRGTDPRADAFQELACFLRDAAPLP